MGKLHAPIPTALSEHDKRRLRTSQHTPTLSDDEVANLPRPVVDSVVTDAEARAIVHAVDTFAQQATRRMAERWERMGCEAGIDAANPFRQGTHAHECWNRGRAIRTPAGASA